MWDALSTQKCQNIWNLYLKGFSSDFLKLQMLRNQIWSCLSNILDIAPVCSGALSNIPKCQDILTVNLRAFQVIFSNNIAWPSLIKHNWILFVQSFCSRNLKPCKFEFNMDFISHALLMLWTRSIVQFQTRNYCWNRKTVKTYIIYKV